MLGTVLRDGDSQTKVVIVLIIGQVLDPKAFSLYLIFNGLNSDTFLFLYQILLIAH